MLFLPSLPFFRKPGEGELLCVDVMLGDIRDGQTGALRLQRALLPPAPGCPARARLGGHRHIITFECKLDEERDESMETN